ncbi:hypothetical protein RhiirA5_110752 [Rhizophagus irregularis]|uniref:Uncharacterized protein n=1 Tax=Rhizophagus irregularis TaxID=588596 RepID=A0A2I1EDI4_9GLOM|nr:hypothetical protein RhiirA5_110752 [Rhizophagus irregularis]PKC70417.1 hypothetical protein RhiirA1_103594 [Rhizophagus irregularis]PKY20171.1 hypothetical protein RhiirB3_148161 [Rhizophagus irregularis]
MIREKRNSGLSLICVLYVTHFATTHRPFSTFFFFQFSLHFLLSSVQLSLLSLIHKFSAFFFKRLNFFFSEKRIFFYNKILLT